MGAISYYRGGNPRFGINIQINIYPSRLTLDQNGHAVPGPSYHFSPFPRWPVRAARLDLAVFPGAANIPLFFWPFAAIEATSTLQWRCALCGRSAYIYFPTQTTGHYQIQAGDIVETKGRARRPAASEPGVEDVGFLGLAL